MKIEDVTAARQAATNALQGIGRAIIAASPLDELQWLDDANAWLSAAVSALEPATVH